MFDCPGQVELYMHAGSTTSIIRTLTEEWHYRLTCMQLVDAHLCTDASKCVAVLAAGQRGSGTALLLACMNTRTNSRMAHLLLRVLPAPAASPTH